MASDRLGGIKLKQLNTRNVVFTREHFRKLAVACSKAMLGMSTYHPSNAKPAELRPHLNELYHFVATHLSDEYDYTFDEILLHGLQITHCDLVQGVIHVQATYVYLGSTMRFCLQCTNDCAPYGKGWPEALVKVGGVAGNFEQTLSMV